ncbi:alpha-2,8-sialyltransferase 8B-like [Amphiura filiformis]|uniref:alpha-2,8-sialyltransferase 8B-like n=1 Tax=Amphiura filiformis TaxID=82378 RepID=UPI003B214559
MVFFEDFYIRLKVNRTKLHHTKLANNIRVTRMSKITDELGIHRKGTCAVVGNGGVLLDSGCGKEIDAHDFIIRNNLAPIKQYVNDVGYRTDIMSINNDRIRRLVTNMLKNGTTSRSEEDFDILRFLNETVLWHTKSILGEGGELVTHLYDILQKHHLPIRLAYSPENNSPIAGKVWNINFPTTGLISYTFASVFCDKVSLYGFYPFSKGLNRDVVQHHYYEERKLNYKTDTDHTFVNEYQLLTDLHRKGALRFVSDTCNGK